MPQDAAGDRVASDWCRRLACPEPLAELRFKEKRATYYLKGSLTTDWLPHTHSGDRLSLDASSGQARLIGHGRRRSGSDLRDPLV